MAERTARLASFDVVAGRLLTHLREGRNTALVGSPGCGTTTCLAEFQSALLQAGFSVIHFDVNAQKLGIILQEANSLAPVQEQPRVLAIDHVAKLLPDDLALCVRSLHRLAAQTGSLCLWCGSLDVRGIDGALEVKLCSDPAAHVSCPLLPRDEQLAAFRAIAERAGCHWGEAILYLMLDLCGGDLALCDSATRYFPGDWSHQLYDEIVWDRVKDWFDNSQVVRQYSLRLKDLSAAARSTLELIRFGGHPTCKRGEIVEELSDEIRSLVLAGILVQDFLPGFYRVRNLIVRFLLNDSVPRELFFRRAANERAAQLLQDAEAMLRQVLAWAFERLGPDASRARLEKMQQPGELITADLNKDILKWARESCSDEALKGLNELILSHRTAFKAAKSVWTGATSLMKADGVKDDGLLHIHSIDYLTLNDLATLVTERLEGIFPNIDSDRAKKQLKDRWEQGVAQIRRLRNQVAHLRECWLPRHGGLGLYG